MCWHRWHLWLAGFFAVPVFVASFDSNTACSQPPVRALRPALPELNPKVLRTISDGHSVWALAFSPNGKLLASGGSNGFLKPTSVNIWDVATGKLIHALKGHARAVFTVAFSPDGKTLASGSHDATIKLWDVATGKEVATLRDHDRSVLCVAFSPDGKLLASGSGDKTIRIWSLKTRKSIRTLTGRTGILALSSDGKFLAGTAKGDTIKVWRTMDWKEVTVLKNLSHVAEIAFSPNGKRLAVAEGSKNRVSLWSLDSAIRTAELKGDGQNMMSVAFSRDGGLLASAGWDKTVHIWDGDSGKLLAICEPHKAWLDPVAFSPDGRVVATGGYDNSITLWAIYGK